MPNELNENYVFLNTKDKYKRKVYKVIMDDTINSLEYRFESHQKLYADISVVDITIFFKNYCPEKQQQIVGKTT